MRCYMEEALTLAVQGKYSVSPNPMVGCVIVQGTEIVGRGWHQYAGGPHAEIYALQEAGAKARGAEVFVTLEPCCHYGKTGPCVEALIQHGVRVVQIPFADPNPQVFGKGIARLREAGIQVIIGECVSCSKKAREINAVFWHVMTQQRAYVTLKWAMSLDGQIQTPAHQTRAITSKAAQQHSHWLRQAADAILVGANTARQDNPLLTTRLSDSPVPLKHPLRIILSSDADLPLNLKLFAGELPGKTLVVTTQQAGQKCLDALSQKNIDYWTLPADSTGNVALTVLLNRLAQSGINHLLVEGGARVHTSFIKENLVDAVQVYIAPQLIGHGFSGTHPCNLASRLTLQWQQVEMVDTAVCLCAEVIRSSNPL